MELFRLCFFLVLIVMETAAGSYYDTCPPTAPDMLNIHLICHTHDDLGWLKTLDQYYYGSKKRFAPMGVQYILDSVVKELMLDSNRRFSYVETAFFSMWLEKQSSERQNLVRQLVNEGRLEIVNGGWAMHDEACVHYVDAIDQMSLGLKYLNETLGPSARPLVAWQIDPFGHSRELARLSARMGFDAIFLGRIDFEDRKRRKRDKEMQTVWITDDRHREADRLFTGIFYEHYSPPPGFCFDVFCDDDPITDDVESEEYNKDAKVDLFLKEVREESKAYATNHLLLTMGNDFNYNDAYVWFSNLDKLIRYVNERNVTEKVNVLYSTPACYIKALSESGVQFPKTLDDFFPYASDPHAYWTGYFTSKPSLKRLIRYGSGVVQTCKQLAALANLPAPHNLMSAMAVAQHHDAVTGTAKAAVSSDYAKKVHAGIVECDSIIGKAFNTLDKVQTSFHFCHQMNITTCEFSTNNDHFLVHVYNPLSRSLEWHAVRLPVYSDSDLDAFLVTDKIGNRLTSQLVPIPKSVLNIPGRDSRATHELVFKATDIAAMSRVVFEVRRLKSAALHRLQHSRLVDFNQANQSTLVSTAFDLSMASRGLRLAKRLGKKVTPQFGFYVAHDGDNSDFDRRASGAYIFRPKDQKVRWLRPKRSRVFQGPVVTEVHVDFEGDFVSHVVRMYDGVEDEFENEALIGPIPVHDNVGKEVIVRYDASDNDHDKNEEEEEEVTFYTDSNGRQMLRRVKDSRLSYKLNVTEPTSGNYYPVTSRLLLRDGEHQLVVLTDRSVAGTSLKRGVADLLVHRRLLLDDAFGVDEALDEEAFGEGLVVRTRHWVQLGVTGEHRRHRLKAQEMFMAPTILFSEHNHIQQPHTTDNGRQALPDNVHLLTMEPWDEGRLLVRLEHIFDVKEDKELSKPATVDLRHVVAPLDIENVEEVTLTGTLNIGDLKRINWPVRDNNIWSDSEQIQDEIVSIMNTIVTIQPMDIRSFLITTTAKNSLTN